SNEHIVFRDLDVEGEVFGRIEVSGLVTIRPGGIVEGALKTSHLEVEEGGGLYARCKIESPEVASE
ncbi:MAG: polymer-forming cytoskeletal protein, partial [Verrucomicrobiota bacterium]